MMELAINELTESDYIKNEIRNLKRTIRYAKLAQRALDEIVKNGYYEGRVKVIRQHSKNYNYQSIGILNLKKEVPTGRELAPDFKDIKVEIGPFKNIKHGGTQLMAADVFMTGTIWSDNGSRDFVHGKVRMAIVRYKKNGLSLELFHGYRSEGVYNLFENYKTEKSKETLKALAKAISQAIIGKNNEQFFLTMGLKIPVWLVEEGRAEEFASNLLNFAKIAEVMNAASVQ